MADHNRFFVPPTAISRDVATVSGPVVHQIKNVLRLRPGDSVTLLDNSGWKYQVEITRLELDSLVGTVRAKSLVTNEPRAKITVYQGLLRPQQFEFVLQKATEVGVSAIVPTICQRCLIGNIEEANRKLPRWERVIAEAAEQSGRGKLAALRPAAMLPQALEQARGLSLMLWEDEDSVGLREVVGQGDREPDSWWNRREEQAPRLFSLNLFVGPEGGFTPDEVAAARAYSVSTVTLGPRLLRAETAAIVAVALVLYELGDMVR